MQLHGLHFVLMEGHCFVVFMANPVSVGFGLGVNHWILLLAEYNLAPQWDVFVCKCPAWSLCPLICAFSEDSSSFVTLTLASFQPLHAVHQPRPPPGCLFPVTSSTSPSTRAKYQLPSQLLASISSECDTVTPMDILMI